MHVHAGRLDARQLMREPVERVRLGKRHAEFVLGFAGRDLVVRLGVDVGVHAEGDARRRAARRRYLAQRAKLWLRLDVEGEDAGIERERHLGLRLADAREHDLLRCDTDFERAAKLAFGHDVHAGALAREGGEHAEIGVGLDRIADKRARHVGKRVSEHRVMAFERRRRVAIEGRADLIGKRCEVDLLGVEHARVAHASVRRAAPVGEMVH